MEMTPQEIAGTTFRVVKKGFDPEEVRLFQVEAARALEMAQSQASLMEQRARAAVAKAQGLAASATTGGVVGPTVTPQAVTSSAVAMRADDAETISRTLVLAQRTAEHTIAEASREAAEIRAAADADARDVLADANSAGAKIVADARTDARRAGESERARAADEIQALLARLEFLRGDVSEVEAYASAHRQRLAEAAESLRLFSERPLPGAELRRPTLSPAADTPRHQPRPVIVETPVAETPAPAAAPVEAPVAEAPAPAPVGAAPLADQIELDEDDLDVLDDDEPADDDLVADDLAEDHEPAWANAPTLFNDVSPDPSAPLVIQPAAEPIMTLIAPSDQTPGDGSPLLPPLDMTFSDMPTGELPAIPTTSGPVIVPDLDADDADALVGRPAARSNDLRIIDQV